jgi:hypothetical protein
MAGMMASKTAEVSYTEEMRVLLHRAQQGDGRVVPQLRELLEKRPELWQRLGDVAGHVEEALLTLAGGKSLLARESIRKKMDQLRAELSVPPPTPVEKLLIDRVVICWAQTHLADLDDLQRAQAGTPQAALAQRRQSGAQARYLAALKQLTVVRKLLRPTPTALDLLRFPVEEKDGGSAGPQPRRGQGRPAAAAVC